MVASWRQEFLPKFTCIIAGRCPLLSQAYSGLELGLRPRTAAAYLSKFRLFLEFCICYKFPLAHVDTILSFLEFLTLNGSRALVLTSYVSVFRHYFKMYDLDCSPLNHRKIHLFIMSVSINSPYCPKVKANFTIPLLIQLAKACDHIRYGFLYKAIFLLAYFGFLRLSNLAPSSSRLFDSSRHFLHSDIIFGPHHSKMGQGNAGVLQVSSNTNPLPYVFSYLPCVEHVCTVGKQRQRQ